MLHEQTNESDDASDSKRMFAGFNVTLDSMEPGKLSGLGVTSEGSHDEITGLSTLIQVKRLLINRVINDATIWARSMSSLKWGNMCIPVTRTSEIEHNVALPNAVIRDAVVKGASNPRKIDELDSGSDKHGAMRIHKGTHSAQ